VQLSYTIPLPPNTPLTIDELPGIAEKLDFPKIADAVKTDVLEVFAQDESASVQVSQKQDLKHLD
jgi:urate oxidase